MQRFLLIICLSFLFLGCKRNNNNIIDQIESLSNSLDSLESVLLSNEIDTLAALSVATNTVELRIKNNYNLDTIDYEFGKKMDSYKIMRRSLGPLGKNFSDIKKGIIEERNALKNLTNDISNNIGKQEEFESNFKFEEEKVKQLQILLKSYLTQKDKTMATFHKLHDELNSFSLELIKNKQQVKSK